MLVFMRQSQLRPGTQPRDADFFDSSALIDGKPLVTGTVQAKMVAER